MVNVFTCGSSVASGSLRPFGPVSGSNVARGSSVLYLTRGDSVTPLYVSWEQYSSGECRTHSWTRGSSVAFGSLRNLKYKDIFSHFRQHLAHTVTLQFFQPTVLKSSKDKRDQLTMKILQKQLSNHFFFQPNDSKLK